MTKFGLKLTLCVGAALGLAALLTLPAQTAGLERRDYVPHCAPLEDESLTSLRLIVSAPYAPPPAGSDARHQGVDFAYYNRHGRETLEGAAVTSVLPGRAALASQGKFPFGNVVIIETPRALLGEDLAGRLGVGEKESLYLLYAHLRDAPAVLPGAAVRACDTLGFAGKSGNAGVAHLHLETRIGPAGRSFEALGYYETAATPAEREAYLLWRTSGVFRHFDPMALLQPALGFWLMPEETP